MLAVALVHYPTVNKEGRVVTTSVTNFDIHDIARACRTFGIAHYFIVTPVELQQKFVGRIIRYWLEGEGVDYNPTRGEALTGARVVGDLVEAGRILERERGRTPVWVATSAKRHPNTLECDALRGRLRNPEEDFCLIFGTGWGLHPQVIEEADAILEPIEGPTPWNHLSVRSAVSIYLDRLLARRP
jgi:hypothetical protein